MKVFENHTEITSCEAYRALSFKVQTPGLQPYLWSGSCVY